MAEKYRVLDKHVFDCEVTSARWDVGSLTWEVQTSKGAYRARVLAARWDHTADLTGERVAFIGTGASAVQIVPAIAEQVAHLDVYLRTAPWLLPRGDRSYTTWERAAFRPSARPGR